MNRPDFIHMQNLIIGSITSICRNDNVNREVEMTKMIQFLTDMHSTAVTTLAGAVLISAKMSDDQEKIDQMLTAVKNLVEATDADFSMQLRAKVMNLVATEDLPNPFSPPQKSADHASNSPPEDDQG